MGRLYITQREIDLIADLNKEFNKDINGQVIYYYPIREDATEVHDLYKEAIEKVFDPPIEIDAKIDWEKEDFSTDKFGHHAITKITIYLHYRDILDRNILIREGDYFSFGDKFYEITSVVDDSIIYGQVEHLTGYVLVGKIARKGQINVKPNGPLEEKYTDNDAVQNVFEQQRGDASKGDKRQLVADGVLDKPISGASAVNKKLSPKSSFYGDK